MFQQALQFFTSIPAAFSTGKKRKRMAEEQAATEDRATANKLRTVSAPQQRVSSREDGADPHAGPPAPPVTHTQHTATTPGLHSTLQTLKLSHDIKPVSNGQALMPPPSSSQQQHHQRPSLAGLERLQPSLPSNTNTLLHSTQPRHHTAVHAPMQTHQPVVAKRLHADFNKAEHAQQQAAPPQQQTGLMPPPSSRITSAHSSFTRPHQPLYSSRTGSHPRPTGLSLHQYKALMAQNERKEQELAEWRQQHHRPSPMTMIDLTEDHDSDLQAARKAGEEQQALRAHEQRLHKSILQRAQGASEAERSFSSAESVGRELARKTEELNARMRAHHLRGLEIRGGKQTAAAPPTTAAAQPSTSAAVAQAAAVPTPPTAAVEEISLLDDTDEEEEQEEEEDQQEEDDEAEMIWHTPEQLTPQEMASWDLIFCRGPGRAHLDAELGFHNQSSIPLTRGKMQCMQDGDWLNDELINVCMALLQERDTAARRQGLPFPKCHFFNSFFLNKLFKDAHAYKYANVRRWTLPKKLSNYGQASSCLLECDRLVVPVHCGTTHWACAVIDLQHRQLVYYDSLRGSHNRVLDHLAQWVADEAADKLGQQGTQQWGDAPSWPKLSPKDVPTQNNGSDCGVFAIKFAECIGSGRDFDFTCHHMPRIRRALAHRVLQLCALNGNS